MEFPTAYIKAIEKMADNFAEKGDSWKTMPISKLCYLLEREIAEWQESGNKDELLDIMNIASMVFDRMSSVTLKEV